MQDGYRIFLTIELARLKGLIPLDLEYDLMYEQGEGLFDEFQKSKFDNDRRGLYDCLEQFLNYKKIIKSREEVKKQLGD